MGNCISAAKNENELPSRPSGAYGSDSKNLRKPAQGTNTAGEVVIRIESDKQGRPNGPPPVYSEDLPSVENILSVLQNAHEYHAGGVNGAFNNVLRHRSIHLWVDNNYNLPPKTVKAISLAAMLLLSLGRAFESDMDIYFTGYSNLKSTKLSREKREIAEALKELLNTDNWDNAVKMIGESEIMKGQELGLHECVAEMNREQPQAAETAQSCSRSFASGAVRSSILPRATESRAIEKMKDDEKHCILLDKIRDLQTLYWQAWPQRELEVADFQPLYKRAMAEMKRQPKNRNNLCFTIEREINLQKRLWENKSAQPTTILILTGSPLVKSEVQALKKHLKGVLGGGEEFAIEALLFYEYLDSESRKNHGELDESAHGDKDIYDMTEIKESSLLTNGPSSTLLIKILNSHLRSMDTLKIPEKDKYGSAVLSANGNTLTLPSIKRIAECLGLPYDSEENTGLEH